MLHFSKSLSSQFSIIILRQKKFSFLQQLRAKSSRRHNIKNDGDEDDDKVRKRNEKPEGYIHLQKSRGQHLLTNPRVLDSIVRKSDIKPTDTVLEIGPGTGNLTMKLLEVADKVISVEIDKRMVEILHNRASAVRGFVDRLTIIGNDVLKTDLPPFDLVVANIPYGISSHLISKLVFGSNPFRSATLLLQKEFAKRLLAKPGDSEFNRLAVNVKLVAEVEFIMNVSKKDFLPCPKVDSSVVKIRRKAETLDVDLKEWWEFTRTCFCKKNKTLGATFKQKKKVMELLRSSYQQNTVNFHDSIDEDDEEEEERVSDGYCSSFREKIVGVLRDGGFEDKRPSKLSNEELLHLLSLFNRAGVYFHGDAMTKDGDGEAFSAADDPL